MLGKIIGFVSCFLCALPFIIISHYNKDSSEPITFWTGDEERLKNILKDIKGYNLEMASLYAKCAWGFLLTGAGWFIHPIVGSAALVFDCTVAIYIVWRVYKRILAKYIR